METTAIPIFMNYDDGNQMKKFAIRLLAAVLTLSAGGAVSASQKKEPLRADWLATDIANMERLLPELKRNEPLTLPALEQIFGGPPAVNELGFGGRTFTFRKPGGYAYFRVSGFVFKDRIGYYEIRVSYSSSWSTIRTVILDTWKRNTDLEFNENDSSIAHKRQFPDVVADYKTTVAARLGAIEPVTVPPELRSAYELLISLGNNSVISHDVCGYGAVAPAGKNAIDALVKANRVDLINNVLRGYNPGGRVYAWLALFATMRKGASISADTARAMDVVRTLDLVLDRCSGCIGSQETAQQIIND
jgi:hypothetical protein